MNPARFYPPIMKRQGRRFFFAHRPSRLSYLHTLPALRTHKQQNGRHRRFQLRRRRPLQGGRAQDLFPQVRDARYVELDETGCTVKSNILDTRVAMVRPLCVDIHRVCAALFTAPMRAPSTSSLTSRFLAIPPSTVKRSVAVKAVKSQVVARCVIERSKPGS